MMVVVMVVVMRVHVVRMQVMRCLLLLLASTGCRRASRASCDQLALFLEPLFEMNFCVTFLLIASRKLPSTCIALKWFLSCVGAYMSGEISTLNETFVTYFTLKWLFSSVSTKMSNKDLPL
jgi:hypothetical protein